MNDEELEAPTNVTTLTKAEQARIDSEVPQILQQVDAKILLNFLKNNPNNNAQINIINVGRVQSGEDSETTRLLLEKYQKEVERLENELQTIKSIGITEYLDHLPQPKHYHLMRNIVILLLKRFETQKEAAIYMGASGRVFSYWMKKYRIPGYTPMKYKKRGKRNVKNLCDPV